MEKRQLLTGEIPYVYGQVYNKVLEVIRDCYNSGREELANQLAISAIEYKNSFDSVSSGSLKVVFSTNSLKVVLLPIFLLPL